VTKIDFATIQDVDEIAVLSKKTIEYDLGWKYNPDYVRQLVKDREKNVVVARKGNALAGFGIMSYGLEAANLDLLGVKAQYRRRGIGKKVVIWLEEVALNAGIFEVGVQARWLNSGARKFYLKLGYELIKEVPYHYGGKETAVFYRKSLIKNA